jgi:hypothetical protein
MLLIYVVFDFFPGACPIGVVVKGAGRQQVAQVALQALDGADVAPAFRLVRAPGWSS